MGVSAVVFHNPLSHKITFMFTVMKVCHFRHTHTHIYIYNSKPLDVVQCPCVLSASCLYHECTNKVILSLY